MTLTAIIARRRIIVTCGTGGVGKTTLSAAIAVKAALAGKRALVITIDPAKRLATSMGFGDGGSAGKLGDDPTDLTEALRQACRKTAPELAKFTGRLEAVVPDTKRTFETFVRSLASQPASAERVLKNPIFQIFAKEFSGTNEYMALERLYALAQEMKEDASGPLYDCIVLDTPPSRNTQAFLEAPGLLARLFEEKLIRWLVLPANKLMAMGMQKALGVLERLTGAGFMTSLVEFAGGLFQIQATFTANLKKVMALLESSEVGFVMVTTPSPGTAPDLRHFIKQLAENRMNFDGIAINRTLRHLKKNDDSEIATEASAEAIELLGELMERETRLIAEIRESAGSAPICSELPELARDVHSVEDLLHVARALA